MKSSVSRATQRRQRYRTLKNIVGTWKHIHASRAATSSSTAQAPEHDSSSLSESTAMLHEFSAPITVADCSRFPLLALKADRESNSLRAAQCKQRSGLGVYSGTWKHNRKSRATTGSSIVPRRFGAHFYGTHVSNARDLSQSISGRNTRNRQWHRAKGANWRCFLAITTTNLNLWFWRHSLRFRKGLRVVCQAKVAATPE